MAWYNMKGEHSDTVLSSRIRFARNIEGYPFRSRLIAQKANEILDRVGNLLLENGFEKTDFSGLSATEALSHVEKHHISREFAESKLPHALMTNEACGLAVMLCEEDHIRLQCILPGLSLDKAYKTACEADDLIDAHFPIAYSEELGYLTHCPTNLGTGMRASVMMFLPALTMSGRIDSLSSRLSKIGLTMRGLYGEGSDALGGLYQISNQVTLGITEEDTLRKLSDMVKQIEDSEHTLRALITPEKNPRIIDRICRAEGTLRHAYMISSSEFLSAYADLRLGIAIGIIKNIEYTTLDRLLVEMMPATLSLGEKKPPQTEGERDCLRAHRIREALAAIEN